MENYLNWYFKIFILTLDHLSRDTPPSPNNDSVQDSLDPLSEVTNLGFYWS